MNPRMPKGKVPKLFLGVHARLVFLKEEDERGSCQEVCVSVCVRGAYRS
jgi:hypothetical protein